MAAAARPVATSPAAIIAQNTQRADQPDYTTISVLLRNRTGTASVFLGGSAAEAAGALSFEWKTTDPPLQVSLEPGEQLFGYATTPQTIDSLLVGR